MKNNNFFRVGMLALALVCGMAVIGCDTGNNPGDETLPDLPSPEGTNEVGGKTAENYYQKCVFNADGTFIYSEEDDVELVVAATGAYSWNSIGTIKTVTLAPQRVAGPQGNLLDKAGWKAATRTDFIGKGLTEANVAEMTEGQYTTITAAIDAYADYSFALQLYIYTISGEAIDTFEEIGPYGYGNARGGEVVVKNDTSSTLTVTTYAGYAGTEATVSVSAGERKEVFASGADTFLTKINITTSGSFTDVDIETDSFFGGSNGGGGSNSSYEISPIIVSDGNTVTITVE
jgi:hypothetical protein